MVNLAGYDLGPLAVMLGVPVVCVVLQQDGFLKLPPGFILTRELSSSRQKLGHVHPVDRPVLTAGTSQASERDPLLLPGKARAEKTKCPLLLTSRSMVCSET